jgi:hypothetical protein
MTIPITDICDGAGTVTLAGKVYHLNRMTPNAFGKIRAWLRGKLPRPFEVVKAFCDANRPGPAPEPPPLPGGKSSAEDLTPDETLEWMERRSAYANAVSRWQWATADYERDREKLLLAAKEDYDAGDAVMDRPAARRLLGQPAGIALMLFLSAQKDRPGLKLEEIEADIDGASLAELAAVKDALDVVNALPDELVEAMEKKAPGRPGTGPP